MLRQTLRDEQLGCGAGEHVSSERTDEEREPDPSKEMDADHCEFERLAAVDWSESARERLFDAAAAVLVVAPRRERALEPSRGVAQAVAELRELGRGAQLGAHAAECLAERERHRCAQRARGGRRGADAREYERSVAKECGSREKREDGDEEE